MRKPLLIVAILVILLLVGCAQPLVEYKGTVVAIEVGQVARVITLDTGKVLLARSNLPVELGEEYLFLCQHNKIRIVKLID